MRRLLISLAVVGMLVGLAVRSEAQVLDLLWSLSPGDRIYLTTDNTQRGMTYNPATGHILVANRAGGVSVNRLDAATGADLGTLDVTGITGGTFALNMISAGSDGAIYGCNLTVNSTTTPFRIYRWADESAAPQLVYSGDPSGGDAGSVRFGDTFDVRGAGTAVQILAASRAGVRVALITTPDGATFNAASLVTDAVAGDLGLGLAFGAGDTFWGTASGRLLRVLDLVSGMTISAYDTTVLPASLSPIGVDPVNHLLGAINLNATAPLTRDTLNLYDINALSTTVLNTPLDSKDFPVDNANGNGVGAVDFGGNVLFALDANNGLVAYRVVPEPSSVLLTLLGGLGLVILAWRRR